MKNIDANTIGPDYIARLLREVETVKTEHAGKVASVAACDDFSDDLRQSYLAELLRFTAHDMEIVLLQLLGRPESPANSRLDQQKAAMLSLYGVERGLWKASRHHLQAARALCPADESAKAKPQRKPPKP